MYNSCQINTLFFFTEQDDEDGTETGDGDEWMQGKTLVKPPDQLDLTEAVRTVLEEKCFLKLFLDNKGVCLELIGKYCVVL